MNTHLLLLILIVVPTFAIASPTPSEIHEFRVRGDVSHRCYAGFSGRPAVSAKCDNKNHKKTVFEKVLAIKIVDEPDPDDSNELAGSVSEEFEFKGQKFVFAVSLFKSTGAEPYRVRMVADRNGLKSESHAVFASLKSPRDLNKLALEYFSNGDKETVSLWATIEPATAK